MQFKIFGWTVLTEKDPILMKKLQFVDARVWKAYDEHGSHYMLNSKGEINV